MSLTATPLPELKDIGATFSDLLGRPCKATRSTERITSPTRGMVAAVYVDDIHRTEAVVAVDAALGAYMGAAIAMVPAGKAQDCAEAGQVTGDLVENLAEVLNVTASLFNAADVRHLKLGAVHSSGVAALPADVVNLLRGATRRLDATVEVQGYGTGTMVIAIR